MKTQLHCLHSSYSLLLVRHCCCCSTFQAKIELSGIISKDEYLGLVPQSFETDVPESINPGAWGVPDEDDDGAGFVWQGTEEWNGFNP